MKLGNFLYRQKQRWKYHSSQFPFDKKVAEINRYEPIIFIHAKAFEVVGCSLLFDIKNHSFIVDRFDLFRKLLHTPGVQFEMHDGRIIVHYGDVSLIISTAEELYIFYEIYIDGCYRIYAAKPFNVIDIGMNVGFASLFFASQVHVNCIYSFEPFRRTFDDAMMNFRLNVNLASKVHAYNLGVAYHSGKRIVSYSADLKGKNSIDGDAGSEEIILKDAYVVFEEILNENLAEQFFIKMDCEGAEFEIFDRLKQHPISDKIFGFIIEWHGRDPKQIIDVLVANDFRVHLTGTRIGLITAFR